MNRSGIHIKSEHEGMLRTYTHAEKGQNIPLSDLMKAKGSPSAKRRRQATFALNARSWHRAGK
jgi:hypothetical protein